MNKIIFTALAAASCVIGSASASAALVTISENGDIIASWQQSLTPTPVADALGTYTQVAVSNITGAGVVGPVAWYNIANAGGVTDFNGVVDLIGPQVYTGSEDAPIFTTGVWTAVDQNNDLTATITISVPEPATWAMMLAGMGMIGFALRRRHNVSVTYA